MGHLDTPNSSYGLFRGNYPVLASRNCVASLTLKATSYGKSERMKVVDKLMKLNLEKMFAKFGAILREICLFKVRGWNNPARMKMKN